MLSVKVPYNRSAQHCSLQTGLWRPPSCLHRPISWLIALHAPSGNTRSEETTSAFRKYHLLAPVIILLLPWRVGLNLDPNVRRHRGERIRIKIKSERQTNRMWHLHIWNKPYETCTRACKDTVFYLSLNIWSGRLKGMQCKWSLPSIHSGADESLLRLLCVQTLTTKYHQKVTEWFSGLSCCCEYKMWSQGFSWSVADV